MKRNLILNISILLGVLLFVSACDLFVSPPRLRENPNDSRSQITGFAAGPTGATSITTVWNWVQPKDWLESYERIDEIKIIHSTLGYQELNIPFVRKTFTDKSIWQYEWKDLKADTTHYFSLFAKTEDGRWVPSYKIKLTLPGKVESGAKYTRVNSINIDNGGNVYLYPSTTLVLNPTKWIVLFFDIPKNTFIKSATITLSPQLSISGSDYIFAPLDKILPKDNNDKWNSLVDNSIVNKLVEKEFTQNPPIVGTFDITEVVRAAVVGPKQAIVIKTISGGGFTYDNSGTPPFITADISK